MEGVHRDALAEEDERHDARPLAADFRGGNTDQVVWQDAEQQTPACSGSGGEVHCEGRVERGLGDLQEARGGIVHPPERAAQSTGCGTANRDCVH